MYRTAAEPAPIPEVITLRPHRGRRILLTFCLWFMAFWLMVFGPAWIVDAFVTGEGYVLIAPGIGLLVAAVWLISRTLLLETIHIGNTEIRRVGFFRERGMKWRDVTGSRKVKRHKARGVGYIELLMIEGTDGQELLIAPLQVSDPSVIRWALDRVREERIDEIDDRVRREGNKPGRRVYFTQGAIGLAIFVATGLLLLPFRADRYAERQLRSLNNRPIEDGLSVAGDILDNPLTSDYVKCSAGDTLVHTYIELGDVAGATRACEAMRGTSCFSLPYDDCTTISEAVARAHTQSPAP